MEKKEYLTPTVRMFKLNSGALLIRSGNSVLINNAVGNGMQLGRDYDFSLEEDEEDME